nr:LysR family transcriptional regulator [Duganella guangzhouensis]
MRGLDINLLICLDALLSEKNVSRAAEKTCRSQSAMSHSLARLRAIFEDELLTQVGRKLVTTALGNELAAPVRKLLLQFDALALIGAGFDIAKVEKTITIMATDYSGTVFFPELVRRVAAQAPGLRLHLRHTEQQWPELLERGEIDMIVLPQPFVLASQPHERLFSDQHQCIAWTGNSVLSGDTISREQYASMGHVLLEYAGGRTPTVNEYLLRQLGITRRAECVAPHFTQIPFMVAGTDRIATVPRRVAFMSSKYLPLKLLAMPVELPPLEMAVQYHQYQELDPVLGWLRAEMRAVGVSLDYLPAA